MSAYRSGYTLANCFIDYCDQATHLNSLGLSIANDRGRDSTYSCSCRNQQSVAIGSSQLDVTMAYGQPSYRPYDRSQYAGAKQWLYREEAMTFVLVDDMVHLTFFAKPHP